MSGYTSPQQAALTVPPHLAEPSGIDPALAAQLAAQLQQIASPTASQTPHGVPYPPLARAGLRGSRTLLGALSAVAGVVAVVYLSTPSGGVTPPEVAQAAILALGTIPAALAARSGLQALRPTPTYPPSQNYPQPPWPPIAP